MAVTDAALRLLRERLGGTKRTWVITGVAGFIGSNLLEALLILEQTVVGVDNFATGSRGNLDEVREIAGAAAWKRFRFIEADICDPRVCADACIGANVILHQAALGSAPRSISDPAATNAVNVGGHLNMLVAARDAKADRMIFATSSSTYGDNGDLPKREDRIGHPLSPYAVSKRANEMYGEVFARVYGFSSIGLRYFNVFGPRQSPSGPYAAVIPLWIYALANGRPCVVFGDGHTMRDFCYIDNVIQANVLAALAPREAADSSIYNIAVGKRTSLLDLYESIRVRLEGALPEKRETLPQHPEFHPLRDGDIRDSQADISKAQGMLGYLPTHDLREGLDAALGWYLASLSRA